MIEGFKYRVEITGDDISPKLVDIPTVKVTKIENAQSFYEDWLRMASENCSLTIYVLDENHNPIAKYERGAAHATPPAKDNPTPADALCADMWSVISGINLHNERAWEATDEDDTAIRENLTEIEKLTFEAWQILSKIKEALGE